MGMFCPIPRVALLVGVGRPSRLSAAVVLAGALACALAGLSKSGVVFPALVGFNIGLNIQGQIVLYLICASPPRLTCWRGGDLSLH